MIDLRSDTVTRPSAGMRDAMARADVGDDVLGRDPTMLVLERRTAELLGKEDAAFFPTGMMANETALALLAEPGTEVICEATSHYVDWEVGAPAFIARVMMRGVQTDDGILTAELVERAIRPKAMKLQLQTSLITVENTHSASGGRVMPLENLRAIRDVARAHGLPVHLDGARLWHASAESGVSEAEYAACADTVMVALSKGLGCPIGSMLAGTAEFIQRARIMRRRLGGAMRQVGILAAAGIYALEHNRARIRDDHQRARRMAELASSIPGIAVVMPQTNIIMIDITRADLTSWDVTAKLAQHGVLLTEITHKRIRGITHLDVGDDDITAAADALARVMQQ